MFQRITSGGKNSVSSRFCHLTCCKIDLPLLGFIFLYKLWNGICPGWLWSLAQRNSYSFAFLPLRWVWCRLVSFYYQPSLILCVISLYKQLQQQSIQHRLNSNEWKLFVSKLHACYFWMFYQHNHCCLVQFKIVFLTHFNDQHSDSMISSQDFPFLRWRQQP